ncbi:hypothetical protein [Cellulomonas sp. P5_C5]
MSGPVRLLAGDGRVRVGAATFPGGPLPDGRVALLGVTLRRLGLGERDRLVALAEDDARAIARLVGGAASDVALPADERAAAAVEAVALDLAGASHEGPLARTRVLAARVLGPGADGLAAADADDLAAELARAVEQDDGWTRLPLSGLPDDESAEPAQVRDRLAQTLLDRAREPLDVTLLRALLLDAAALEPGAESGVDTWADALVDAQVDDAPGGRPEPAHASLHGWARAPEEPEAGRPTDPVLGPTPAAGGTVATPRGSDTVLHTAGRPRIAAGATGLAGAPGPTGRTGVRTDWSVPVVVTGTADRRAPAPSPTPLAGAWTGTHPEVAPAPVAAAYADRWGAPVPPTPVPRPAGTSGARSSWSGPDSRPPTAPPQRAASPSLAVLDPGARPATVPSSVAHEGSATPRSAAARASVDDVALSLHRAADLRGVRR